MHDRVYLFSIDPEPYYIDNKGLAIDALIFIKGKSINALPIVDEKQRLIGTITWQMIVKAGIVA